MWAMALEGLFFPVKLINRHQHARKTRKLHILWESLSRTMHSSARTQDTVFLPHDASSYYLSRLFLHMPTVSLSVHWKILFPERESTGNLKEIIQRQLVRESIDSRVSAEYGRTKGSVKWVLSARKVQCAFRIYGLCIWIWWIFWRLASRGS